MAKQTIEQVEVAGQRVLMRVDFNVPLDDDGSITDDRRIRMALPTIRSVLDRGGSVVLMSHLGRPKGEGFEAKYTLKPAADRLGELLDGATVQFVSGDPAGDEAAGAAGSLRTGEVVLLDNLRFNAGEKSGDASFGARLASYGDIYCNDAFGTAHRDDASMVAVPEAMAGKPRVAGLLLEKELKFLSGLTASAASPFVAVLGGAKVSDKLGAIEHLMDKVDTILIGGAMAYTFLRAQGNATGRSLVEPDMIETAKALLERAGTDGRATLGLPSDHVCAVEIATEAEIHVHGPGIPDDCMGLDIGPATRVSYAGVIESARTIVWNGPMGVFETPPFDEGTRQVAEAAAKATGQGAVSVIGGGDSAAAVEAFDLADAFSHVSTGGGASMAMLEGKRFRSVEVLDEAGAPASA